jgi:CubicO group peptidase (beta-lactamase class C family)
VQAVLRRDPALLRTGNWGWVFDNQLPPGMSIGFPDDPVLAGRGHSFAGSVSFARTSANPHVSAGDLEWGGMAGTHWLVSPANDYAVVLMTQRMEGFGLPFWTEFKERTWQALASPGGSAPD